VIRYEFYEDNGNDQCFAVFKIIVRLLLPPVKNTSARKAFVSAVKNTAAVDIAAGTIVSHLQIYNQQVLLANDE